MNETISNITGTFYFLLSVYWHLNFFMTKLFITNIQYYFYKKKTYRKLFLSSFGQYIPTATNRHIL